MMPGVAILIITLAFLLASVHSKSLSSPEYDVLQDENVELRREMAELREQTRRALEQMVRTH